MTPRSIRTICLGAGATLVFACASQSVYRAGQACEATAFTVTDGFSAARRGTCTVLAEDRVRLEIRPEDDGYVNDSAWYAFRIIPGTGDTARISLQYRRGHHRYWPKTSHDGLNWNRLDESRVTVAGDGRSAAFDVPLAGRPVYVAAQELITPTIYAIWNRKLAAATGVPLRELGESKSGLPIHAFDSNAGADEVLLLIGRQHPPEVTGAFAMFAFMETVFGNSELAIEFRHRFRVVAIPLLNPDGVVGGHWRHNLGHTDINRDWGPFTQPETRPVADLLDQLDAGGHKLRMFVDFHSTRENVFYTQLQPTHPPGFTQTWLENAARRVEDYLFRNGQGSTKNAAIAKNYIYTRYGIPAVTYEVADDVDRDSARAAARVFAEELMRLMLSQSY